MIAVLAPRLIGIPIRTFKDVHGAVGVGKLKLENGQA